MSGNWLLSFPCTRTQAELLTGDVAELAALDSAPVIVATELDEDADAWRLDVYVYGEDTPDPAIATLIARLLGWSARRALPVAELLPDADWVTLSQSGLEPVRAGRFHVHTGTDAPDPTAGTVNFRIDAGAAFGTGHHDTTAGCLHALDRLRASGRRYRAVADIGTGTGLLAFAALHLWPRAHCIASDIDPESVRVSADNARINGVATGVGPGRVALVQADGVRSGMIHALGPYDLVCANILAGPLIALAPALAGIAAPGGTLLLAGLLQRQRPAVIAAYRRAGWRLDDDGGDAEWPVLRLTRRRAYAWKRPNRAAGGAGQAPGDFGSW
jgi:ribosomal protein L11 methyltransferase